MGWASKHIEQLKQGKTVSFRPHGRSMAGKIDSGQLVTVVPRTVDPEFKGAYLVTMERIPDEALANTDRIDALQGYVKKQREKDSKPDAFGRKYRGE